MSLATKTHYNAYKYTKLYDASSFETAPMQLLAVSDHWNTKVILDNWGHVVDRLAENWRLGEAKAQRMKEEGND